MMRFFSVLLVLGLFFAVPEIRGAAAPPKSVDPNQILREATAKYPESEYLTALDAAGELTDAKERALGNLAKIFSVRIEDDSVYNQNLVSRGETEEKSDYLSRSVLTVSREDIEGAEVAEIWFDKKNKVYYALAVLNKKNAASGWRKDAQLLRRDIEVLNANDAGTPPYAIILSLIERQALIADYNFLIRRLRIVEPQRSHRQLPDDTGSLVRRQAEQFAFLAQGEDADLISVAGGTLAAQGMRPVSVSPNLRLDISLDAEKVSRLGKWYVLRRDMQIEVFYDDLPARQIKWNLKEESLDRQKATERMQLASQKKIRDELFLELMKTLSY